jgi:hypothetical protein
MKKRRISVRLDGETVRRARALIPALSMPGWCATISDVYRAMIMIGLEEVEKSKLPSAPKRRGHPLIRGE